MSAPGSNSRVPDERLLEAAKALLSHIVDGAADGYAVVDADDLQDLAGAVATVELRNYLRDGVR